MMKLQYFKNRKFCILSRFKFLKIIEIVSYFQTVQLNCSLKSLKLLASFGLCYNNNILFI